MKRITGLLLGCAGIALVMSVFSCSKDTTGTINNGSGADAQDSILLNLGYNIILPSYQSLADTVNSLDSAITDFNQSTDSAHLARVKTLFKNAYVAWQAASEYDYFGPATDPQSVLKSLNIFPVGTTQIDNNIANGNYNVNTAANIAAKGFPALDYLLFGANNTELIVDYTTGINASNRKRYLSAVAADIKTEVNAVLTAWSPQGGNYVHTFVTATGNSAASGLGLLLNSYNQDFEILKNFRLALPLGKFPIGSSLAIQPEEVEAFYSGISVKLALAQLKAVQGIYLGTGAQGNGLGLRDYLVKANAQYNGGLLSDTIAVKLATAVTDLQAIPDPLAVTIQDNPGPANAVFAETQKLVVLFKTDMPSALGVLINYGDNDGD